MIARFEWEDRHKSKRQSTLNLRSMCIVLRGASGQISMTGHRQVFRCIITNMRQLKNISLGNLSQYSLAILVVVCTTLLLWFLRLELSIQVIALLYLLPVVFCTRLWGLGPGILSAMSVFLCLNYFFIPPFYTLLVHQSQDLISLIVFLIIAVVISQLLGHDQESIAAAISREREATNLYELSITLAGLHDEKSVALVLIEKIHETFVTDRVEIVVKKQPENIILTIESQERVSNLDADVYTALATTHGKQGEVRIWRRSTPISKTEDRLLKAFTSQGSIALERARLDQAENRAKVLEESDRLKSALLSSVSHELRSPLATIKASISSLRSGDVDWSDEARLDLMEAIEEESDHLNQLVGNLLDMSRIETGALNPQRKWNSIEEIVSGVIRRMHHVVRQHQVTIDIPPDLPLVPVDYIQMEQVFSNLISNSTKYAPEGTKIKIIACTRPDQTILVQVSNQGPHVAEEHLERIFDKFYRVTAADKVTGTGLGLSICKGIIEAHNGRIWAENTPDGFIFNFTLPIRWEGSLPDYPKEA